MEVEFADVDNIEKPGLSKIDLDKVILTNGQKNDMLKQMLRSKQFWVLFAMQAFSAMFPFYVVSVFADYGHEQPALNSV